MNKICTSLEQSQRLIELGIDVNTADMHYYKNSFGDYIEGLYNSSDLKEGCELKGIEYIPAWSLSALLELIPTSIDEYTKDFSQLEITKCSVSYVYAMGNLRKGCLKDNLLDAAFEMVCWLKENNKL